MRLKTQRISGQKTSASEKKTKKKTNTPTNYCQHEKGNTKMTTMIAMMMTMGIQ